MIANDGKEHPPGGKNADTNAQDGYNIANALHAAPSNTSFIAGGDEL